MTTEDNKQLVRRFVEQVINTGAVDRVADFVSADCVETDGKVRVVSGVAGMAAHVTAVRSVWEGLTLTIDRQIAEGEWVVTQVTARGIHRGEWLGIRPTGRPAVMTGVNVDRVVDGRIVEHGGAANMLDALLEIGAVRPVSE
jgi:predicted ester cyclase